MITAAAGAAAAAAVAAVVVVVVGNRSNKSSSSRRRRRRRSSIGACGGRSDNSRITTFVETATLATAFMWKTSKCSEINMATSPSRFATAEGGFPCLQTCSHITRHRHSLHLHHGHLQPFERLQLHLGPLHGATARPVLLSLLHWSWDGGHGFLSLHVSGYRPPPQCVTSHSFAGQGVFERSERSSSDDQHPLHRQHDGWPVCLRCESSNRGALGWLLLHGQL